MKKAKKNVVKIVSKKHNWMIGVSPDAPGGSVLNRRTGKWEPRIYWCTRCERLLDLAHSDVPGKDEEMVNLVMSACKAA